MRRTDETRCTSKRKNLLLHAAIGNIYLTYMKSDLFDSLIGVEYESS
jgi:hypothetical protein